MKPHGLPVLTPKAVKLGKFAFCLFAIYAGEKSECQLPETLHINV
jgi:hypothetical protein